MALALEVDLDAARGDLDDLSHHLNALRRTELSRLQQARLDLALASSRALNDRFGGGEAPERRHLYPTANGGVRPFRVLVVEDNAINLHVALGMLRMLGVEAASAETGEEAMEALSTFPYDLVMLDVMLPDLDGMEITRQFRERFGDRLVIVGVTAMPDAEAAGREAGMNAVFAKPLRLREVIEALDLCIPA